MGTYSILSQILFGVYCMICVMHKLLCSMHWVFSVIVTVACGGSLMRGVPTPFLEFKKKSFILPKFLKVVFSRLHLNFYLHIDCCDFNSK